MVNKMSTLYDMHCHIDLINDMDFFCKNAQANGIVLLAMTTTPKAYEIEIRKLSKYQSVKIALGMHPQLVHERLSELPFFERNLQNSQYIGEIGLDYNRQFYSSKTKQLYVFERIIESCYKSKVISIHSIHAEKDILDILEKYNCPSVNACILHWYSGTTKLLERSIELGCYFSINEYMLNSSRGQSIIQKIPPERLLLESDAPFISNIITAEQLRRSLSFCLDQLSVLKGMQICEIIKTTSLSLLSSKRTQ